MIGICSGVGLVGLSPSSVESEGISSQMLSELVELQGTQLVSHEFPVDVGDIFVYLHVLGTKDF